MKDALTDLIVQRLKESHSELKAQFNETPPIKVVRHFTLDNLLPIEIAQDIYRQFPKPEEMHNLRMLGKIKLKYSHLKNTAAIIQDINAAIQDPKVVAEIEAITEVKNQIPDPTRFAGGASTLLKGYYINPHVDNSHDVEHRKYYRTMNVLYYVSPNWGEESGGNYELWDENIEQCIVVPSLFNRLLVMETNRRSWHAVNPVQGEGRRCAIFNYYFSEQSPEGVEYFFKAPSFKARPEQRFRRSMDKLKSVLGADTLR